MAGGGPGKAEGLRARPRPAPGRFRRLHAPVVLAWAMALRDVMPCACSSRMTGRAAIAEKLGKRKYSHQFVPLEFEMNLGEELDP